MAEQSRGEEWERRRLLWLFIAGMSSPGCDSAQRRRHGDGDVPARGKAVNLIGGDPPPRVAPAASSEVEMIFEIITELPLHSFLKLLRNFLKKLKISKNESYSIFQTLQLCF